MRPRPPKAIEAVVGLLVPPVHREHVLGDLHERYTSSGQYIVDSVRTVPLVILSQIARTTAPRVLLMEACAVYGSFLAAVWLQGVWLQGTSFLFEQSEVLQLVIPAIAGLLALVVGDAYATPGIERRLRSTLGAALCVAFAFLSQAALSVSYPDLLTPRWIMILGGGMSLLLLSTLRLWFLPGVDRLRPAPVSGGVSMTHKEIRRKAQEFETKIKRRNRGEYIAVAVLVAIFGWQLASSANLIANIGGALIIAGALYVAHHLRKQGSAKTLPADAAFVNSVAFYPGFPFWPSWSVYDSRLPAAMQRFSHCCQVRYSFRCRCGLRMLADHGVPAKPEGPLATPLPRRPSATRVRWLFRAVDVTLRAQVAPKSAAACRRTTSGSDAPPQAATNNIAPASRAVRPS